MLSKGSLYSNTRVLIKFDGFAVFCEVVNFNFDFSVLPKIMEEGGEWIMATRQVYQLLISGSPRRRKLGAPTAKSTVQLHYRPGIPLSLRGLIKVALTILEPFAKWTQFRNCSPSFQWGDGFCVSSNSNRNRSEFATSKSSTGREIFTVGLKSGFPKTVTPSAQEQSTTKVDSALPCSLLHIVSLTTISFSVFVPSNVRQ